VRVYPAANPHPRSGPPLGYAFVNPDGSYTVSGLPSGDVKVQLYGEIGGYANQWYGGTMATATTLNVTEGQTTQGVDFTAVPEAVIAGQVKAPFDPDATIIRILNLAGQEIGDALPEPDGSYEALGLPAGSYKVEFTQTAAEHAKSWYGGKTFASAATVTVVAGQTVTGIDSDVVKKPAPPQKPAETTPPKKATVQQSPVETTPPKKPVAQQSPAETTPDQNSVGATPQQKPEEATPQARGIKPAAAVTSTRATAGTGSVTPDTDKAQSAARAGAGAGDLAEAGAPADLTPLALAGGVLVAAAGVALFLAARLRTRR
jgi:hypothetical protein